MDRYTDVSLHAYYQCDTVDQWLALSSHSKKAPSGAEPFIKRTCMLGPSPVILDRGTGSRSRWFVGVVAVHCSSGMG